ncbi:hypothetical protein FF38_07879 [Lucilia cuprina]|uniref:Uncharacterized protein n=1 Tax=Lucilia cuprina TaxID=7375 RepID=A0A0L0BXX2_LUCCU|nr:hypothetical protein FF38_07879 [Lucilia cuprina]
MEMSKRHLIMPKFMIFWYRTSNLRMITRIFGYEVFAKTFDKINARANANENNILKLLVQYMIIPLMLDNTMPEFFRFCQDVEKLETLGPLQCLVEPETNLIVPINYDNTMPEFFRFCKDVEKLKTLGCLHCLVEPETNLIVKNIHFEESLS